MRLGFSELLQEYPIIKDAIFNGLKTATLEQFKIAFSRNLLKDNWDPQHFLEMLMCSNVDDNSINIFENLLADSDTYKKIQDEILWDEIREKYKSHINFLYMFNLNGNNRRNTVRLVKSVYPSHIPQNAFLYPILISNNDHFHCLFHAPSHNPIGVLEAIGKNLHFTTGRKTTISYTDMNTIDSEGQSAISFHDFLWLHPINLTFKHRSPRLKTI